MGFGFTIADSAFGQKVKKILDRPRCKTLQEGDVLIEINGKSVRGMSHSEVVQVLKECTRGSEANISIQRGLLPPGSGNAPQKKLVKLIQVKIIDILCILFRVYYVANKK